MTDKPRINNTTVHRLLWPVMIFAVVATPICWLGAWWFRDRIDFSNALIGLGCLPIVASVCAYFFLVVKRVGRD